MSMIYNTLQNVQSSAGAPILRSVVPPVMKVQNGEGAHAAPLFIWALAGMLSGVLLGLLMIG